MLVLHGSPEAGLTTLSSTSVFGNNGSVDGIGVYTTDNTEMALHYAKGTGSVYIINVDTHNLLRINDETLFSQQQIDTITPILNTLPKDAIKRLATDFAGKIAHRFIEEEDALLCYRQAIADFKNMGGYAR